MFDQCLFVKLVTRKTDHMLFHVSENRTIAVFCTLTLCNLSDALCSLKWKECFESMSLKML